jgi:hemerythrin superfamily protein
MEEKNEIGIVEAIKEIFTGEKPGNAIWLLKQDHRKVEELFKDFESSRTTNQRYQLIQQIIKELDVHTRAEEKLLYPILAKEDEEKNGEANEEHHVVKLILAELAEANGSESNLKSKVKVLSEVVKHHVKEEENGIFQTIERSGADMDELGQQIIKEKARLMSENSGSKAKKPLPKSATKAKIELKKANTKKVAAKKAPAKKVAAKKAPAKKAPAKKVEAKKAPAKKVVQAKKPAAKKVVQVKKPAAKKAPASRLKKAS